MDSRAASGLSRESAGQRGWGLEEEDWGGAGGAVDLELARAIEMSLQEARSPSSQPEPAEPSSSSQAPDPPKYVTPQCKLC